MEQLRHDEHIPHVDHSGSASAVRKVGESSQEALAQGGGTEGGTAHQACAGVRGNPQDGDPGGPHLAEHLPPPPINLGEVGRLIDPLLQRRLRGPTRAHHVDTTARRPHHQDQLIEHLGHLCLTVPQDPTLTLAS